HEQVGISCPDPDASARSRSSHSTSQTCSRRGGIGLRHGNSNNSKTSSPLSGGSPPLAVGTTGVSRLRMTCLRPYLPLRRLWIARARRSRCRRASPEDWLRLGGARPEGKGEQAAAPPP